MLYSSVALARKECEMELTQKGEMVSRLQVKAEQIGKILQNLEKYNHYLGSDHELVRALRSPTTNEHNLGEKLEKLKAASSAYKAAKSKDEGPPNKKLNLQEIPPFRKTSLNDKPVPQAGEWTSALSTAPVMIVNNC